jgi:hypothetical protein
LNGPLWEIWPSMEIQGANDGKTRLRLQVEHRAGRMPTSKGRKAKDVGEADRRRGISFGSGEIDQVEIDGKREDIVTIDGISRLLIERDSEASLEGIERLVRQIESFRAHVTSEQWRRFQEAVAIACADLRF